MAGFRIPGPSGAGPLLAQAAGTWAGAISLPIPDPLEAARSWVRRELRQGLSNQLERVGALAVQAAVEEIRALGDDIGQKLAWIAALPDGIRNQVAYEVFAAGFSHYLPKKLLRQYIWGRGAGLTLSLQEMMDCNPLINLQRSRAFMALLEGGQTKLADDDRLPQHQQDFELRVPAGALTNGTLGQFSVRAKGQLLLRRNGEWTAQGKMSFFDTWDFDPKDFTTGGRSLQGELKTRFAHYTLPGQAFDIDSEQTAFSQTQLDRTIQWQGGEPKSTPDRIAALDVALKEAD
ncbi:hypothetical protein [Inhella sp.]|uniref:hypothetical protein n=1 Tax=Inhella sp. TaxID=1921806 RepID=UPI0035B11DB6